MSFKTQYTDRIDWQEIALAEIGKIVSGATPSTEKPEYWNGSIVWITPADLSKISTRHILQSERTITELGLSRSAAHLLPPQSLVISSRAPIGHMALPLVSFCTNQGCKSMVFFEGQDPDFHYYNLRFWVRRILTKGEGTTFAEISKTALENVRVPVPQEPKVQMAIGRLLSSVDLAIEQTDALLTKRQRIKSGLMRDLLSRGLDTQGQLRDPATHRFKPSPLGLIPEEWDVRTLADVVPAHRPIVYGILMPGKYVDGGVPVIKVKDIQDGSIRKEGLLRTHPKIDAAYSRSRLLPGDLLFTIRGTVGRTAVVPAELGGANITQDTARITVADGNTTFIRHCLEMPRQRSFIELHTLGQAVKGINLGELRKLPVQLPHPDEQAEIARVLDEHDRDTRTVVDQLEKLRRLKFGLMQDLLTNRVPVTPLLQEEATAEIGQEIATAR